MRRRNVTAQQKQEVLRLFEAGLSAREIVSTVKLSLSEVYKIRREDRKADPELGPHQRELFYFGKCLRDRFTPEKPHKVEKSDAPDGQVAMWRRSPVDLLPYGPKNDEEESVEREWGFGRYDARRHSLFRLFKRHLAGFPCWTALEKVEKGYREYRNACQEASKTVMKEVRDRLPSLAEQDAMAMVVSLLLHAYYRLAGSAGLSFSYEPQQSLEGDKVWWHLQLGHWGVGHVEDPVALQPLALTHQELAAVLSATTELKAMSDAHRSLCQAIERFRQALSPDARLRKLVLHGQCDLCP